MLRAFSNWKLTPERRSPVSNKKRQIQSSTSVLSKHGIQYCDFYSNELKE